MAGFGGKGADAETLDEIRAGPGYECQRHECPKCGDRVGDLPCHLRACDGGDGA